MIIVVVAVLFFLRRRKKSFLRTKKFEQDVVSVVLLSLTKQAAVRLERSTNALFGGQTSVAALLLSSETWPGRLPT